ncbi:hypothetical protein LTR65_003547 [Meristemomyces frigidus]
MLATLPAGLSGMRSFKLKMTTKTRQPILLISTTESCTVRTHMDRSRVHEWTSVEGELEQVGYRLENSQRSHRHSYLMNGSAQTKSTKLYSATAPKFLDIRNVVQTVCEELRCIDMIYRKTLHKFNNI